MLRYCCISCMFSLMRLSFRDHHVDIFVQSINAESNKPTSTKHAHPINRDCGYDDVRRYVINIRPELSMCRVLLYTAEYVLWPYRYNYMTLT